MYKKSGRIISNKFSLSNYIDGADVYNSELLLKLHNPNLRRDYYEISVYEYRPDLIAKDFYGSDTYTGLVIIQNGFGLENYTKGTVIELIYKTDIDKLIQSL